MLAKECLEFRSMFSDFLCRQLAVTVIIGKDGQTCGKGQDDARLSGFDLDFSDRLVCPVRLYRRRAEAPGQQQHSARDDALEDAQCDPAVSPHDPTPMTCLARSSNVGSVCRISSKRRFAWVS